MTARDDAWILTFTGRRVWPLDPRPEDICIEDIAHALALTCRFTGHCRAFYSVAQHSVLCADYVRGTGGDVALQLAALLHDGSEAYLPDLARPVKGNFMVAFGTSGTGLEPFRDVEDRLMRVIYHALGVTHEPSPHGRHLLKQADNALLMAEKRDLMPEGEHVWPVQVDVPWNETIKPWDWQKSEMLFLSHYQRLRAAMEVHA